MVDYAIVVQAEQVVERAERIARELSVERQT
jgi:hypothetical protein